MSEQSRDALSHWWWPGQSLRIVYGVWVDQLWYWQNVRPRLRGRTEGWGIFGQAFLGAALTSALAAALMIWALGATGVSAGRLALLLGAGLGLVLVVIVNAVDARIHSVATGVAGCVAGAPAYAVTMGLGFALILGGGWNTLVGGSPALAALWSAVLGLSVGWARGIYEGVTSGASGRMKGIAGEAVFFGVVIVGGIAGDLAAAAVASVAFVAGHWVGGHWSTRQVADDEARRHLAHPEER